MLTESSLHLEAGRGHEFSKESLKFTVSLGGESTFSTDGGEDVGGLRSDESEVKFFELGDLGGLELVEETSDTSV